LETQALKAAQSAATPALSEGSTRLLHDIVLGIVTSPEVRRRRRRRRSDVTRGKLNCAAAAAATMLPPPRLSLSLLLL
jgi:hypothetical protein